MHDYFAYNECASAVKHIHILHYLKYLYLKKLLKIVID